MSRSKAWWAEQGYPHEQLLSDNIRDPEWRGKMAVVIRHIDYEGKQDKYGNPIRDYIIHLEGRPEKTKKVRFSAFEPM